MCIGLLEALVSLPAASMPRWLFAGDGHCLGRRRGLAGVVTRDEIRRVGSWRCHVAVAKFGLQRSLGPRLLSAAKYQ